MYTFLLMILDFFRTGQLHWYIFFILFILIRWIIVRCFANRYKPIICENKEFFTSVIIPVFDESIDVFEQVITRIADQHPDEIIVAINGPENESLYDDCLSLQRKTSDNKKPIIKIFQTKKKMHCGLLT